MSKSISDLINSAPEESAGSHTVDVSEFYGEAPGEVLFVYAEPDAPVLYSVPRDARAIKDRNPIWPDELAGTVSLLALCHAEPAPGPGQPSRRDLYISIAKQKPTFLRFLEAEIKVAFPRLTNFKAGIADEKKS